MSAQHSSITQTLFPLLTAALLVVGCSDPTAPSSTESLTSGTPTSQSPADGPSQSRDTTDASRQLTAPNTTNSLGLSTLSLGTAYPQGISCSNHTLQQNLPNMTSLSGRIETTTFYSYLYRWNPQLNLSHGGWQYLQIFKGPYKGASDGTGRVPLFMNVYWFFAGTSVSGNTIYFYNLPSGYYMTVEKYIWSNGASASFSNQYRYCKI